ncbi:predicted protein [Sclerotinia sclerotiorum 1980 UF-70]|nr:predicted protein [Sclerotinia sclerotiorum 1980 UF-70]EDN95799.1 predicted protein [Sclerotinia sclerotiorum 1980 UF-70]
MSNLYTSIGRPSDMKWLAMGANIKSFDEASRETFIKEVEAAVGPEGFMIFLELNHGSWLPLFNVNSNPQLGLKRIILGNPLIAVTMLSQSTKSLDAGLFVPVEIMVRELPDGEGTEIIWQVPSTMIAAVDEGNSELLAAAEVLDRKLEELIIAISSRA